VAKELEQDELLSKAHLIKCARVYQLKAGISPEMKFIGYEQLIAQHGGVDPENYTPVFDGDVGSADPETVYRMLRDNPPSGYTGHALTRSDVLELYNPKESRFFYIDTFALKPVDFDQRVVGFTRSAHSQLDGVSSGIHSRIEPENSMNMGF